MCNKETVYCLTLFNTLDMTFYMDLQQLLFFFFVK